MGRKAKRSARLVLLAILLTAGGAAYVYAQRVEGPTSFPEPTRPTGTLVVHYVDVGQGDGTVWELPGGGVVVYDCGPPVASGEESPMVRYLRDEIGLAPGSVLGALVASHGHLDHVGGCEEIFDAYAVSSVYEAWYEGDDAPESYRRFLAQVEAEGASVHRLPELAPGARLFAGAQLLWPRSFAPGGWDAIAEASLVVRLTHGSTSFCFQGDIGSAQEAALEGRCDVFLVGHHGSRQASSAAWLERMRPSIAVASFGENGYGHPHPEALCRVRQAGAEVYATHRSGGVVVSTDGIRLQVSQGQTESADFCAGASYWP